jgi:hypothetical protein
MAIGNVRQSTVGNGSRREKNSHRRREQTSLPGNKSRSHFGSKCRKPGAGSPETGPFGRNRRRKPGPTSFSGPFLGLWSKSTRAFPGLLAVLVELITHPGFSEVRDRSPSHPRGAPCPQAPRGMERERERENPMEDMAAATEPNGVGILSFICWCWPII